MTVSTDSLSTPYTGDGATTTFATDFPFLLETDLVVSVGGTTQTLGSHYSVTGGDGLTGSITFVTAPASGSAVILTRDVPISQLTDYTNNDALPANTLEHNLDKLTMIAQQHGRSLAHTLRAPLTDPNVAELPNVAARASKFLLFDSSGNPVVTDGTPSQPNTVHYQAVVATDGQTVISTTYAYTTGAYQIHVYVNGEFQYVGIDYLETDANTITFTTPLIAGDNVAIITGSIFDITLAHPVMRVSEHVLIDGQTDLTTSLFSYVPGNNEITVFKNGARLMSGDFTELNSTTVRLAVAGQDDEQVAIVYGQAFDPALPQQATFFERTDAEITAGVTPTDNGFKPGDIRRYGASLTLSDNAPAIRTAIACGKQSVYIPDVYPNAWKVSTAIKYKSRQIIYGDGPGSRIDSYCNNAYVFWYDYANEPEGPLGTELRDFFINGASHTGTGGGIHWTGASHSACIRNVWVRGFVGSTQRGIKITGQCYYLVIDQPDLVQNYIGILLDGTELVGTQVSALNGIHIRDPRINGLNLATCFGIIATGAPHTKITGGYIENCDRGVDLQDDSPYCVVDGTWLEGHDLDDIRIQGAHCKVRDTYHWRAGIDTSNHGIYLNTCDNALIDGSHFGNRVGAITEEAIYTDTSTNTEVRDCHHDGTGAIYHGSSTVTGIVNNRSTKGTAAVGDANKTLVAGVDQELQRWATTLTANRTVTLSSTGIFRGAKFRIARTGLGAYTLDVGGVKTIANSTAAFVDVEHDGTAWRLTGYGAL